MVAWETQVPLRHTAHWQVQICIPVALQKRQTCWRATSAAEPKDILGDGDRVVAAPPGGIAIGQMFRASGPSTAASLAVDGASAGGRGAGPSKGAWMQELAGTFKAEWRTKHKEQWATAHYATGNVGVPKNTNPALPAVTFAAVPWAAGASVVLPVYR